VAKRQRLVDFAEAGQSSSRLFALELPFGARFEMNDGRSSLEELCTQTPRRRFRPTARSAPFGSSMEAVLWPISQASSVAGDTLPPLMPVYATFSILEFELLSEAGG
jgi:hypothetical protein